MSSKTIRDQETDHLLTPKNSVLVIIDFQPIQIKSVASMDRRSLVENITVVAKAAKLYSVPTVVSTVNVSTGLNQPMIHQLADLFQGQDIYDRTTINAWEDDEFRAAVKASGRKKVIIAAIWTEACLIFPSLDMLNEGYEVYPVADAVGGTSLVAHETALLRLALAGAKPTPWVQLLCELQRDWNRHETAKPFAELVFAVEGA